MIISNGYLKKKGMVITMNFAEKLLNLRTEYGYSQETLAEKLDVSRQAVSKWESGATLKTANGIYH